MPRGASTGPWRWLLPALVLLATWWFWPSPAEIPAEIPTARPAAPTALPAPAVQAPRTPGAALPDFLPAEAHHTIALIQRGGPYPYRQDGGTFGNREGHLPRKPRGWYREFTVDTPGLHHRGARRIVTGGDPPSEWYYTDDHYDSFRRFDGPGDTR